MIRRPPRSTLSSSSAASDVYKRQHLQRAAMDPIELAAEADGWRKDSHGDGIAKAGKRAKLGLEGLSGPESGAMSRRLDVTVESQYSTLQSTRRRNATLGPSPNLRRPPWCDVFSQRPSEFRFPHGFSGNGCAIIYDALFSYEQATGGRTAGATSI